MKLFEILEKKLIAPKIYMMNVYAPRLAKSALPGQFLIVMISNKSERIPLTICDYDAEKGTVVIVFQIVGKSTEKMAEMNVGDTFADVVGPLGRESEWMHEPVEELQKQRLLFVAGGVGTAPVYPQVKWLKQHGVKADVIIGARDEAHLFMIEEMYQQAEHLYISTDDGSAGMHGKVTDVIKHLVEEDEIHYDQVIAIGPMIMMKFVAELTKKYGIKTWASLNTLMVDGTGMCGACRVTVGGKTKFTCVDGPEFDAHQVNFDEAMRRQLMFKKHEIATDTEDHKCNLTALVNSQVDDINDLKQVDEKPKHRVPVREQEPDVRNKNFEEVCYGYNTQEAMLESLRCINCKNPGCVTGCPVSINIPGFIAQIKNGDFEAAARVIDKNSSLPAVCGRVCPQETQCEERCILGVKGDPVAIGKLERFVADYSRNNKVNLTEKAPSKGVKVAVVGSGPAGITCAGDLAKMGYDVTIFEVLHEPGGVLVYGIPEFRLPKNIVAYEIENVKKLGVKMETDVIIGRTITIDDLMDKENFKAVFIGSGAGLPKFMNIPGENLNGVLSANELLTRANLMKAFVKGYETPIYVGQKVAVVGGGNVAMDAARVAKRLGADVYVVYRRTEKEMPARAEEVHHAHEEGINFLELTNPVEVIGNDEGWVKALKCVKMQLGEPDASGRRAPVEIPGSEYELEVDTVVMSLGTSPNPLIINSTKGLDINKAKGIDINEETGMSSRPGVFAGGDAVTGAATVILAMGAGKKAAKGIDKYLQTK